MIGMNVGAPPIVERLLESAAGKVITPVVVPGRLPRRVTGPDNLIDVVSQLTESFFALAQRKFGVDAFGDVLLRAHHADWGAVLENHLSMRFDPAGLAVLNIDDAIRGLVAAIRADG